MRLMSDRAYAYAYGRLYIYGPLALGIEANQQVKEASKVTTGLECKPSDRIVKRVMLR